MRRSEVELATTPEEVRLVGTRDCTCLSRAQCHDDDIAALWAEPENAYLDLLGRPTNLQPLSWQQSIDEGDVR
jgi:hypothetical protein